MHEVFRELDPLIDGIEQERKKSINSDAIEAGARIQQAMGSFITGAENETLNRTIHLGGKEFGRIVVKFIRGHLGHETPNFAYFYKKVDPYALVPRELIIIDGVAIRHYQAPLNEQFFYTRNLSGDQAREFLQDLPEGPGDALFGPQNQFSGEFTIKN